MPWDKYHIAYPWVLLLIPIVIALFYYKKNTLFPTLKVNSSQAWKSTTWRHRIVRRMPSLRLFSILLLIIALSRPQSQLGRDESSTRGIDIVISLDVSPSMLATDLEPDRLTAAKKVAESFVDRRINDRIGLVIFSGESFTQCPVTSDHQIVKMQIENTVSGILEQGTAIGMGLASAVNRLKNSTAKSKVVILMTDGVNNTGDIDPLSAYELAKALQVKVYCIGIGKNGYAKIPFTDPISGQIMYQISNVEIDEEILQEIASKTGGKYYRATDNKSLQTIYEDIDKLETTALKGSIYNKYQDHYYIWVVMACLLLITEFVLKIKILKTLD